MHGLSWGWCGWGREAGGEDAFASATTTMTTEKYRKKQKGNWIY